MSTEREAMKSSCVILLEGDLVSLPTVSFRMFPVNYLGVLVSSRMNAPIRKNAYHGSPTEQ